jgi:hypothetical protein
MKAGSLWKISGSRLIYGIGNDKDFRTEMTKKRIIVSGFVILSIIAPLLAFLIWNMSLRRAEYGNGKLVFDDHVYMEISYKEIEPYKETWKVICKTKDGSWTIYEIKEYPDHEYVAARSAWEGRVFKHTD